MGNCLENGLIDGTEDEEFRTILRNNPWMRKLPFINSTQELQPLHSLAKLPGEFCWSYNLSPEFVADLCFSGFIPMSEQVGAHCVLLPKLHSQRCVLLNFAELHVSRKVRKRAGAFHITVDTCFDEVVRGCQAQHGEGCWLHPPLIRAFRALHQPQQPAAAPEPACSRPGPFEAQEPCTAHAKDRCRRAANAPREAGHAPPEIRSPQLQQPCCQLPLPPMLLSPTPPLLSVSASQTQAMLPLDSMVAPCMDVDECSGACSEDTGSLSADDTATIGSSTAAGPNTANTASGPDATADTAADELAEQPAEISGAEVSTSAAHRRPSKLATAKQTTLMKTRGVRFHSIELWCGPHLVAGELGYSLGSSYTSLSGFYCVASSGAIQCVATARILQRHGFRFWDLGMELPYKLQLGARSISRSEFLRHLAAAREQRPLCTPHIRRMWVPELLDDVCGCDGANSAACSFHEGEYYHQSRPCVQG